MRHLINMYRAYMGRVVFTLLFGLGLFSTIQTIRLQHQIDISREYSAKIARLDRANLLTNDLRQANAELIQERDDLLELIRNAESANQVLPDDIRDIVNRMQSPNSPR